MTVHAIHEENPMTCLRLPLSIAFVLSGVAGATAADQAALLAKLDPYKEEWRPCQEAATKLMENALARSTASAENRNADYERLAVEGDGIKKDIAKRGCPKIQERVIKDLRGAGASDQEMQAAWGAFVKSFAPAEPKAASPAPTPASAATPDALAAVLAPHRETWRPCVALVAQLKDHSRGVDHALAGDRKARDRYLKQGERLSKQVDEKCIPLKSRMVAALGQTGASEAEMDAAWNAFMAGFEAPAPEVAATK
jgi:hypothetical protein